MDEFLARLRFRRDHRWAPDRMSAYLDGELSPRLRGRVERHVAECRDCRRVITSLRLVLDALRRLPAPPPRRDPVEFAVAVRARLSDPRPPAP